MLKHKLYITIIALLFSIVLASCSSEETYIGPKYLGMGTANQEEVENLSVSSPILILSQKKPNTVLNLREDLTYYVNQQIYLVINFEQPVQIADMYEIVSLVIEYPSGTSIKWTSTTREFNNDPNSRSWFTNNQGTKIYIPITLGDTPNAEGVEYKVSGIKFIDGTEIKDVRFDTDSKDVIRLKTKYREVFLDSNFLGVYNLVERYVIVSLNTNLYNPDSINISKIYLNDELISDSVLSVWDAYYIWGDAIISNSLRGLKINLPSTVNIETINNWLYLTIEFIDGQSIKGYANEHVENINSSILVRNNQDFYNLPRDLKFQAILLTDITIDNSFEPLQGYAILLGYQSNPDNETAKITIIGDNVKLFSSDGVKVTVYNDYASYLTLINIKVDGKLIIENKSDDVVYFTIYQYDTSLTLFDFEIISLNGAISISLKSNNYILNEGFNPQHYFYTYNDKE
jgi:hypothetical protein